MSKESLIEIDFENYSCYDKINFIGELQSQKFYLKNINNNIFTFERSDSHLLYGYTKINHLKNIITWVNQFNTQLYVNYIFLQPNMNLINLFANNLSILSNNKLFLPSTAISFQIKSLTDIVKKRLKFIDQNQDILNSIFSLNYLCYNWSEVNIRKFYSLRKYIDVFDKIKNKVNTKKLLELLILFKKYNLLKIEIETFTIKNLVKGILLEFAGIEMFIVEDIWKYNYIYYPTLYFLANFLHETDLINKLEIKISLNIIKKI